ncbi:hypothetical protein JCGZ_11877 [Jatropha curcas]|uniref:Uncharacterized protein n=1 Tax=Jatropha curcas TaxID=180498 RepID=A0A067LNC5_JATCU|nr:hypothetical protein JCGZ_11877 [Jatropha curcas]
MIHDIKMRKGFQRKRNWFPIEVWVGGVMSKEGKIMKYVDVWVLEEWGTQTGTNMKYEEIVNMVRALEREGLIVNDDENDPKGQNVDGCVEVDIDIQNQESDSNIDVSSIPDEDKNDEEVMKVRENKLKLRNIVIENRLGLGLEGPFAAENEEPANNEVTKSQEEPDIVNDPIASDVNVPEIRATMSNLM